MNNDLMFSSKTDDWSTPQWLFDRLNSIFCFTVDVCADESNHKCEHYFTKQDDGLKKSWGGRERFAIHRMVGRLAYGLQKLRKQFWTMKVVW